MKAGAGGSGGDACGDVSHSDVPALRWPGRGGDSGGGCDILSEFVDHAVDCFVRKVLGGSLGH